jgi:oligopeptide/dipeptide ABC transporter ATP-binding protein
MSDPILSMRAVSQVYYGRKNSGWTKVAVRAVDEVDLQVHEGETLAIVGESGSGKSSIAKLLLMLNTPTQGDVSYRGKSLASLDRTQRSKYRREVQSVFQDPASSLNPSMTVEQTLGYIIRRHDLAPASEQRSFILGHLASVGLNPPEQYLTRHPHQLSGGQQQRIAIARAMMLSPKIIIADEPLSSLDVSIQGQVLDLMRDLRRKTNVGYVVISHDLGAMQSIADRTAVMYRGRIVELGTDIYDRPAHPYTRLLLDARLATDPRQGRIRAMAMQPQPAVSTTTAVGGCRFRDRCPHAIGLCAETEPVLRPIKGTTAHAACHRAEELLARIPDHSSAVPPAEEARAAPKESTMGEKQ